MTLVICLTNRRDTYVRNALTSLREHVTGYSDLLVVDDSGDPQWRAELADDAHIDVVPVADQPAGYTSAMRAIWNHAAGTYLFLLEEDFTIDRPVNLAYLQHLLDSSPQLAQIALQRGPWYCNERRIGVLAAQRNRVDCIRRAEGRPLTTWTAHPTHVEHTAGITCNPSLWSPSALETEWPDTHWSEEAMGNKLLERGLTSAWLGQEGDQHVTHHGRHRAPQSFGY